MKCACTYVVLPKGILLWPHRSGDLWGEEKEGGGLCICREQPSPSWFPRPSRKLMAGPGRHPGPRSCSAWPLTAPLLY